MFQYSVGIMTRPDAAWRRLADLDETSQSLMLLYPLIWAILPAVSWYVGTTQVGWTIGSAEEVTRLTEDSARLISFLFYSGMVSCVVAIGYFIHWMAETYGAHSSFVRGILIASVCATPLFLAGAVGFYPVLWLDMLVGVFAVCWSTYLLYTGIPIVMGIPETRGFLFASAVIAVSLVVLVCLLVATTLLWEWGAMPTFTD
ncbi:MAG: YIP1 family protein [Luminiphilus sp.]|nr:YIP1 family protein [Luminiphilus sp.]